MYLPSADLQRKNILYVYQFILGIIHQSFFQLHAGDLILHMAYVFSERTIIWLASGCFQIESFDSSNL